MFTVKVCNDTKDKSLYMSKCASEKNPIGSQKRYNNGATENLQSIFTKKRSISHQYVPNERIENCIKRTNLQHNQDFQRDVIIS